MSSHPWHKRYHSDALTGYASLTLEERGAYTTVLDMLYDSGEEGIPDLDRRMAGVLLITVARWQRIKEDLVASGKLIVADGIITNARYLRERDKALAISEKRAKAGSEGGKAKANAKQLPADDGTEKDAPRLGDAQKTSKKPAESEQKTAKSSEEILQVTGLNGAENLNSDLANARVLPLYARATPEPEARVLQHHRQSINAEDSEIDDEDDEKSISFPTALVDRCNILARKSGLNLTIPKVMMSTTDTLKQWLEDGIDFAAVIVPTIERVTAENPTEQIYSIRYFDASVRKAHALAGNGQHKAKPAPAAPKSPIAAEDGPEELIGKFRARLAYAVGEARYRAKYDAGHVAMRIVDGKFLEMIFRSPAEERVANIDTQTIEATASRLGLTLQTRSL